MAASQDDLNLLLSLQDRVLETPPGSPSSHSPGYLSDDGLPKRMGQVDMSVFRDAVEDCLDYDPEPSKKAPKSNNSKSANDYEVENSSGLRLRNQLLTRTELSDRFSDIRFIRLPALKKMLVGDTLTGCWATAGVLMEKGEQRTSSTGKPFCIWKIGCLDEKTVSVFLFGNAFQRNCSEEVGTVFGLFTCSVRKDTRAELGFSLSVFYASQVLKIGTSADFGVCKACPAGINKRHGIYCKYHKKKTTEKYSTNRTEFFGGNLKTAFRDNHLKSKGIYVVEPPKERTNLSKSKQPQKLLSVDALKKALSNAPKVTTNVFSQGIRFLPEITDPEEELNPEEALPEPIKMSTATRSKTSVSVADLLAKAKMVVKNNKPPTPHSAVSSSEARVSKKKEETKKRKLSEVEATDVGGDLNVEKTREKFKAAMKEFTDKISEIMIPIMDQVDDLKIKAAKYCHEAEEKKKEVKKCADEVGKLKKATGNLEKELAAVRAEKVKENEAHVKELDASKVDFEFHVTKTVLEARIQLMEEYRNGQATTWDVEEEKRTLKCYIGEPTDGEEVESPALEAINQLVEDANNILSTTVVNQAEEKNQVEETNTTPAAAGQEV